MIDDLDALDAACKELSAAGLGVHLHRGVKTYAWYGSSVGDYPLPAGFTKEMLGKCDHMISVDGADYQIGVVRNPQGRGFVLLYDFWGISKGLPIKEKLGGESLPKLKQAYAVNRAMAIARKKGQQVRRVVAANDTVTLQITGAGI